MKDIEYQREYNRKRKEAGICLYCRNKAIDGLSYCESCREKQITYALETRKFCKEMNICPRCQKHSIMGDEKVCVECKAKMTNYALRQRNENKEAYNEYMKDYHKRKYEERKEQGLCTRCGRKLGNSMYFTCEICRNKSRDNVNPQIKKQERVANGLCYWCGEPQKPGYKICEKHYNMNVQKSRSENAQVARLKFKNEEHNRYIAYISRKEA